MTMSRCCMSCCVLALVTFKILVSRLVYNDGTLVCTCVVLDLVNALHQSKHVSEQLAIKSCTFAIMPCVQSGLHQRHRVANLSLLTRYTS